MNKLRSRKPHARETKGKIDFSKGNSKTVVTGYWIHLEINEEENNK